MLRSLLEILTLGFPFCVFKLATGFYFEQYWLILLGLIDLSLNLINFFSLLIKNKRIFDACSMSLVVRFFIKPNPANLNQWKELGNSIDVLFSFLIVAFVVGFNHTGKLGIFLPYWNAAVVLNVLGAGLDRLFASMKNLKLSF
jgi:hypothetical protein